MDKLQERFDRIYKGATLYAIQLDGFTHKVFYKDQNGKRHIDSVSGCAPEQFMDDTNYGSVIRSFNKDRAKALFLGYSNYTYQGNAEERVYKNVTEW